MTQAIDEAFVEIEIRSGLLLSGDCYGAVGIFAYPASCAIAHNGEFFLFNLRDSFSGALKLNFF